MSAGTVGPVGQSAPQGLWSYSVERFKERDVQAAALALQNRRCADINLLFYCCWVASTGRGRLGIEDFRGADAALDAWRRTITLPLRQLRERIKQDADLASLPGAAEARGKIIGAEVESERVAQSILEQLAPPPDLPADQTRALSDAVANVRRYFQSLDVGLETPDRNDLAVFMQGMFPTADRDDIDRRLAP